MTVAKLVTGKMTVAEELRALADKIDKGEHSPSSALVIMRNRVDETIFWAYCGEQLPYSNTMGLVAYVQCALYEQANRPE